MAQSQSPEDPEPSPPHNQHASPAHIHITTRRCFIGPIPEGWLKSHRKQWYKQYTGFSTYSSKAATFSAPANISHQRQITGLDGPSAAATFSRSFPQPDDVDQEPDEPDDDAGDSLEEQEEEGASNDMHELETQATRDVGPDLATTEDEPEPSNLKRRSTLKNKLSPKHSRDKASTSSFVTARTKQPRNARFMSELSPVMPPPSSFVTASEGPDTRRNAGDLLDNGQAGSSAVPEPPLTDPAAVLSAPSSGTPHRSSTGDAVNPGNTESTVSLIHHDQTGTFTSESPNIQALDSVQVHGAAEPQKPRTAAHGMVRFNIEDKPEHGDADTVANISQASHRKIWRRLRQGSSHPGEIVKMEKMLVRVDSTMQDLPPDYNENDSLKTSARTVEKWREFVVVCRESTTEDAEFSIQMYKSRVIPAKETTHVQKRSTHEVPLNRKTTRVNLYSSLDKTLVIWVPWKKGTMMYILRTHSVASAVEWYTFIRHSLGWQRSTALQVSVPDLSVTLQLENPFSELETSMTITQSARSNDDVVAKTMEAERAVAGNILRRSLNMLENNPEWADVLEKWLAHEKIGLAWKRYDRLEWVHGRQEQRMYGALAMQQSHELELRPKQHYPTSIRHKMAEPFDEPAPIEGFLIRLTSQKGNVRRLGKMYFKRLYFTTHNQYLCYCRPAKALPPPPPKLSLAHGAKVPKASEIVHSTPLIYAVNPYPNKDGGIEWINQGSPASKAKHDENAFVEAERKVNSMLHAEGYINISHIVRVQNAQRGNSPADANVDEGPDVDFHAEVEDTTRDDGKTDQFDDQRTFELVMKNKLVIRLQAYNEATKKEWVHRLRKLVQYWRLRLASDMDLLKKVRGLNLKRLEIDEPAEAYIGQFGSKWEVTRSVASSKLFNMCGISCCRAITISGTLYRKPKRHALFERCGVILCHGQLLIFHGSLRKMTGAEVSHIQHDRQQAINLQSCYIYSGLVTQDDLLYQNQTFDSNHPGHHALPRVYLEDGWTSTDEDTMTCFVIWQPQTKSFFKASEEKEKGGKRSALRRVSRLGVPGRSIVFKARSRAERDHWVMNIGMEIDRLQGGEDIRVVDKKT
ncbi:hypothetical protein P7C71_g6470, partial [Lecanoromycetidae sp. Uapishka_2]